MRKSLSTSLVLLAAPSAWCHAVLLQSSPQAGALVSGSEIPVTLRFNSRIDAKRSRLSAVAAGNEEQLETPKQTTPDVITSAIRNAKPGPCRIRWQVLASDGHITRGEILFQVK